MKITQISFLSAVLFILASGNAMAIGDCAHSVGNMTVGKVTMNCLQVAGDANFNFTTISNSLKVTGNLTTKDSTLNNLNIVGDVNLKNTTITGPAQIVGGLQALNSTFGSSLQVYSKSISLTQSNTKDIDMKFEKADTVVYVNLDKTTVNGNITFANGNGIVKLNNSKVSGQVIGGKLAK